MERSYKFRIYPTRTQILQLSKYFGTARWVWNTSLAWRTDAYKNHGEKVTGVDFSRELTWLKKFTPYSWLAETASCVLTQVLRNQDQAFANFFAKRARYPKFKRKQSAQSIRFALHQKIITTYFRAGQLLRLPVLGRLKVRWTRIPTGIPKMVTVSRDAAGRYFVSFMCMEVIEQLPATHTGIGIDLGIKDILVDSNGWKSGNPHHLTKKLHALKRYQRRLSRCVQGSQRRKIAIHRVAQLQVKIANTRRDWIQKQTTEIIRRADVIALENLNVKGMVKNYKLARSISDVGINEIRRELEYKAKWYGRQIIIIDRFAPTSKVCSECGYLMDKIALSVRNWECPNCGALHDRDINAARNILAMATGGRPESYARRGRKPPGTGYEVVIGKQASNETRTT